MQGILSFHPVDISFFDDLVTPLVEGRKVNPEAWLAQALRVRRSHWQARRWREAIAFCLEAARPPSADPGASLFHRVKAQVLAVDFKLDAQTRRLVQVVDPALHLEGRPFLVTEASPERVAEVVHEFREAPHEEAAEALCREQMVRLDAEAARTLEPMEIPDLGADLAYRGDLLQGLKDLFDLAAAAREGGTWRQSEGPRRGAVEVLQEELPWRSVRMHSKAMPFWMARDVDGLEAICQAAGVSAPDVLVPPFRLFAAAGERFPGLRSALHLELRRPRDVGGFVPPDGVPGLIDFLQAQGTAIIRVATRHGEGPACTTLLRKMRECATYASRHGYGVLEASGIVPPDLEEA
jgi:hypothetical protein